MKNKKAINNLAVVIIAFALVSVSYFFISVFIYEAGGEYLISDVSEIGQDIIGQETTASINASVSAKIQEVEAAYFNYAFPFDMFFFVMWIITFSSTVWLAFKSNKEGIFTFFGYLFIGTLLMLLIITYVDDFVQWFLTQVFIPLFINTTISMPIFTFYVANIGLISFVWWLVLVLVSIIDRNFISKTGEVEE